MVLYVTTYIDAETHNLAERNLKLPCTNNEGTSNCYAVYRIVDRISVSVHPCSSRFK